MVLPRYFWHSAMMSTYLCAGIIAIELVPTTRRNIASASSPPCRSAYARTIPLTMGNEGLLSALARSARACFLSLSDSAWFSSGKVWRSSDRRNVNNAITSPPCPNCWPDDRNLSRLSDVVGRNIGVMSPNTHPSASTTSTSVCSP